MTPPFPGDWRPVAPTLAQAKAHDGAWWRCVNGALPAAGRVAVVGHLGSEVVSADRGRAAQTGRVLWIAHEWRGGGGAEEWRGDALVCPRDANGAPVPWPEVTP